MENRIKIGFFEAYHVVTERPMYLGQHIIFDDSHHSGVFQRVSERMGIVEEIYKNPDKYKAENIEYPVIVALRELALEEVRKHLYPTYPSRMACLYVSETYEEAVCWADYFLSLKRPVYQIVKLKIMGNKFIGDATKCFSATTDRAENLILAERYWKNEPNPLNTPPIKEILVSGDIEVIELIKEINNVRNY